MSGKARMIVGLGELLWDLFPTGKQLGGAPANFAYITSLLGDSGVPASRVGCDAPGDEAVKRLHRLGLTAEFVQRDRFHDTGTVSVSVNKRGQPRFDISENVAWDFLEWTAEWQELASQADAVCFGSLAQRAEQSRHTIDNFLRAARKDALRVFDINLRQKFYTRDIIVHSLRLADVVKMNQAELPMVMSLAGINKGRDDDSARLLLAQYELQLVCVTRGRKGSLLVTDDEIDDHHGFRVKIADAVGAGDAFTAALVHGFLRNEPIAEINDRANRVGAWVASRRGAMPAAPKGGLPARLREMVSIS